MNSDIPELRRREIYEALVKARQSGDKMYAYTVAKQFVMTVVRVEAIEQEGSKKHWVLSGL
jgi:hypothetical protein